MTTHERLVRRSRARVAARGACALVLVIATGAAIASLLTWDATAAIAPPSKPATTTAAPAKKPAAKKAPVNAARPTAATAKRGASTKTSTGGLAVAARQMEEMGAYGDAAGKLGTLRGLVAPDGDLDLWWAIDLARSGEPDSAARILASPLMARALADSMNMLQYRIYGWRHEAELMDGRFDGWHWYIVRARAEVFATLGRWDEALDAARRCTAARPLAGFEWYLRGLCAARAGQDAEAEECVARARRLSPTLPEGRYLAGLLEWRAGRRAAAQAEFRAAIDLDSSYRAPALALVRSRLPVAPDTLPSRLLNGLREAALLTSHVRPKYDEFKQIDGPATITVRDSVTIPDSLASRIGPFTARPVVLVDERGRIVFNDDAWARAGGVPEDLVGLVATHLLRWRFQPSTRLGHPTPIWAELEVRVGP